MSQTVSFINMKGGVGKTTLAVNVGYALAAIHEKKVLLVDGDPQFNASTYLMTDEEYIDFTEDPKKKTVLDIFVKSTAISSLYGKKKAQKKGSLNLESCVFTAHTSKNGDGRLDLIPSTLALMEIEMSRRGTENRLRNFLKEKASGYDYVLIDCPPTISIFTQAAILASKKYLVPVKPDPLSTIGLPLLERWLADFTESAGIKLEAVGIVFCMVRNPVPNTMGRVIGDLRGEREEEIFDTELGVSTDVATSVEQHKPIIEYAPNSPRSNEIREITEEFLERTEAE